MTVTISNILWLFKVFLLFGITNYPRSWTLCNIISKDQAAYLNTMNEKQELYSFKNGYFFEGIFQDKKQVLCFKPIGKFTERCEYSCKTLQFQ